MSEQFDVIVIGGGPAGATVSGLMAKAGLKVCVLERETFPRYQIGESLLPATVHGVCKLLGVDAEVHSAGFVRKFGGTLKWGKSDEPWTFTFGTAPVNNALDFTYAYQVERAKFDSILLRNAQKLGAGVHQQATVSDVLLENNRVVGVKWQNANGGKETTRARYVVDASGNQSRLYKNVGERVFSKFFQNVALFTYFENGHRLPPPRRGNIFCCAFDQGWFWYIPLSETLTSVGAVVAKEHAGKLKGDPDAAMRGFIDACPRIKALLSKARRVTTGMYGQYRIRKDYSYCNTRFWKPGLVLIGDAACFIDPIFSSGVHLATYSGLLAARSIGTYLKGGLSEEESLSLFEARYRAEFNVFYDFLLGFYDMHQDTESYFWSARKVLRSGEASNHAFLQLVAGAGTTADEFVRLRRVLGELFQLYVDSQGNPKAKANLEARLLREDAEVAKHATRTVASRHLTSSQIIREAHGEFTAGSVDDGFGPSRNGLFWEPRRRRSRLDQTGGRVAGSRARRAPRRSPPDGGPDSR